MTIGPAARLRPAATWKTSIAFAAFLCIALAWLSVLSPAADAAAGRSLLRTISVGPNTQPSGLATDSAGNLYTVVTEGQPRVVKLSPTGAPVPFSGSATYIAGNALTAPGPWGEAFEIQPGFGAHIAVDRSGGPTDGNIYVGRSNDSQHDVAVFVFDKSGTYRGTLGPHRIFGPYDICGVAVNQSNGAVYVASGQAGIVSRYPAPTGNLAQAQPNGVLHTYACPGGVDSSGAVYGGYPLTKYPASQFDVASPTGTVVDPEGASRLDIAPVSENILIQRFDELRAWDSSGAAIGGPFGQAVAGASGVAGDAAGNVLAVDANGGIFVYGPTEVQLPLATTGEATEVGTSTAKVEGSVDPDGAGGITGCEFRFGEDSGYSDGSAPCVPAASPGSPITSSTPVAANLSGLVSGVTYHYRLFATNADGTQVGEDRTLTTTPPAIEGVTTSAATAVTKESATLHGSFVGDGNDTHYYFEWGPTLSYGNKTPAPPGSDAGSTAGQQDVAPVPLSGLRGGTTYHFRLVAVDADGTARGQDESFTTAAAVTDLTADEPTGVTNTSAELTGSFDADAYETHYYFEWGPTTAYGSKTPAPPGNAVPPGSGRVSVPSVEITGLSEGSTYHYRIVASNALGTTYSADVVFKAAEPPIVNNVFTRNVLATSAELAGEVNPRYGETTYYFEWGPTTGYGNKTPVESLGSGEGFVPVSVQLEGLTSGVTYHFRLVALNQYGEVSSPDQSFGFYPPSCPNAQLRQETRSNSLPDCRAYELTTPSYAQGAMIFPLGGPTSPVATTPSRIAYTVDFGTFPEESGDGANITGDLYVSTRTDAGWVQRFIGKDATEGFMMGAPPITGTENYTQGEYGPNKNQLGVLSDPGLNRIVQWDRGWPGVYENKREPSNAPYVWDSTSNNLLERWPTNLEEVTGGNGFVGLPKASTDFSHFVFSSNVVFAPGGEATPGELVCCSVPLPPLPGASIYDNDLASGTVELASVKKDGTPFQGWLYGVADDGSAIVMGEGSFEQKFFTGPVYVRIDGERTEEIAPGRQVRYVGASADHRTIYITSTDQLTAEDTDGSEDLYRWQASDPNALTLVSIGEGGRGNSESCFAEWNGGGCGVEIIDFKEYAKFSAGEGGNGTSDSFVASESGDIYFESPEQLVAGKGETDKANLYLYRKDSLRFVATLEPKPLCTVEEFTQGCSSGPVARMQVTPDGAHMALITASHLTGYDSGEFGEMYTFDPEKSKLTCVSCRPDGKPPVWETFASQNGLFLTYDGRAFFSTADPLVPRDTNEAEDVYEYSEGKPWLISAGLGGSLEGIYGFVAFLSRPGLVGVSANGTDVYFATVDPLVSQDHNGASLKIYDARTGGGFPAERESPNCAAADECHGAVSNPPILPADRTSAHLGAPKKQKAHKHKKKKHKKQKRKQKKGHQKTNKQSSKQGGKRRG